MAERRGAGARWRGACGVGRGGCVVEVSRVWSACSRLRCRPRVGGTALAHNRPRRRAERVGGARYAARRQGPVGASRALRARHVGGGVARGVDVVADRARPA